MAYLSAIGSLRNAQAFEQARGSRFSLALESREMLRAGRVAEEPRHRPTPTAAEELARLEGREHLRCVVACWL